MTTITPGGIQIARIQWLLREAAKQSGIDVSDITTGKLSVQISRLMGDNHMTMAWSLAPVDNAKRCQRKADISRFFYEKTGAEGWHAVFWTEAA